MTETVMTKGGKHPQQGPQGRSSGLSGQPGKASGLTKELKQTDFAGGEARLTPPENVQKKPAPSGVGQGLEALRDESSAGGDGPDLHNRFDALAEASVIQQVDEALLALRSAEGGIGRIERLVEGIFADDEAKRGADKALGESKAAHAKSQEVGLADILGMLIDVSAGIKGVAGLIENLRKRGTAGAATKLLEAGIDAAGGVKGGVGALAGGGDTVSALVGSLDTKLEAVHQGLDTLRQHNIDEATANVAISLDASIIKQRAVVRYFNLIQKPSANLDKSMVRLQARLLEAENQVRSRLRPLQQLLETREKSSGEAQLAKGTKGRDLFELVRAHSGPRFLVAESELEVNVDIRREIKEQKRIPRYWFRGGSAELAAKIRALDLMPNPFVVRPHFAHATDVPLEPHVAKALLTMASIIEQPYESVKVVGPMRTVHVRRTEWESKVEKKKVVDHVSTHSFVAGPGPVPD